MEDKYTSYSSHQLAGEESFIRWVLHGDTDQQWKQWLQRHPSVEKKTYEARQIILSLTQIPTESLSEKDRKELWNKIDQSLRVEGPQTQNTNLRSLWKWVTAAAAALLMMIWFNTVTYRDLLYTSAGEQKETSLPDKSDITLNAGSLVKYKIKSFEEERVLHLDGEAFFHVKPGNTFIVKTDHGTVTVLGTSFNVLSREGRFEVSCYTGKVKVETQKHDQVIITAGEKTTQMTGDPQLIRTPIHAEIRTPEWMQGKFTFEDQPLKFVVEELERQYDINVKLDPDLEGLKYTGLFELGDLEKAVSLITWPLHLKAVTEGNNVIISR